ncbi:putative transposase [Burkholderia pseudomallei MSHR2138]|nr:putative transposase [Burkholderia pseudomallei MSHR2138]
MRVAGAGAKSEERRAGSKGQGKRQKAKGKRQKAKGKRQKAKGKRQKAKGKRQKAKGSPGWARELTGARPRPCVAALAALVQSACGRARGARHVDRCQAAALKLIWLALRNAVAKWTGSRHDWKSAMTQFALPQFALPQFALPQFALLYPERFNMGVRISTRLTHGIPDTSGPRGSLAVSGAPSGARIATGPPLLRAPRASIPAIWRRASRRALPRRATADRRRTP